MPGLQFVSMGAILGAHMRARGGQINELSDAQLSSVMDATMDERATTLGSEYGIDRSIQHANLNRIREFVVSRLDDPTLSPASIVETFGISVRHLYSLFEKQGTSVVAWIRAQRMDRACHDLMQAGDFEYSPGGIQERTCCRNCCGVWCIQRLKARRKLELS